MYRPSLSSYICAAPTTRSAALISVILAISVSPLRPVHFHIKTVNKVLQRLGNIHTVAHLYPFKVKREERQDSDPNLVSLRGRVQPYESCPPRKFNALKLHLCFPAIKFCAICQVISDCSLGAVPPRQSPAKRASLLLPSLRPMGLTPHPERQVTDALSKVCAPALSI